ncbi:MAG TPA: metallopeptidase TldD-related protein [Acidimicrobiales bacterium]|jgi:predicted Zn-dependent protease|nr:metallopeptidase TldD-related protein [Acidimicrobiales bacterium]
MPDLADSTELATDACERTLAFVAGRAEAVATAVVGTSSLTRFANSRIHQNVTEDLEAVSLTVAVDGKVARAQTTRTDAASLEALVERALAAAALRPADPEFAGFAPPAPVPDLDHWDDATAGATPDQRAAIVAAFVEAGEGLEAAGYCSTEAAAHVLVSTTGQRAVGRATTAQLDGIHRAAGAGAAGAGDGASGDTADGYAQATSVRLGDLDGGACGARAAAKAGSGREPRELPPGSYEVVMEPRAVASALVYPAYMGFNGKAHADGTSFVQLGERQWDAVVDIWDDATDPRALGTGFDAEGTPKGRLDLVQAGVSTGLTHDRRSARLAGVEPTGHSVGSEAFGGYATNLFVGGGDEPPDRLVGQLERGLLVTDLWYNRILDPKTQVVTGLTRNGLFLVEEGRIVGPVQNLRYTQSIVAGFGPGKVLGLGDDGQLVGSEGGIMHVPSVRLAAWAFTGNARG